MIQKSKSASSLKIGDRVKLSATYLARNADMTLQNKIAEVIEVREDGGVSVRFDSGRLLVGRGADAFELVVELGKNKAQK
jgi:hypothetical protein